MGLKANWKSVVAARRSLTPASTTSTHSASPAPVTSSRSTTPTPKASSTANRTATLKRVQRQASLELIGGLNDSDVTVGLGSAAGKRPRYGQMAEVQETGHLDEVQPATPAKKRRAPRSLVPEEKSLSVQSLPEFIKPYWKATFVPTMVQFIGQDEQPWSFASDQGGGLKDNKRLVDLVQKLIDVFWPEQSYEVTGGDKIYRIVSILPFCYRARADNVSLQAYQAVVDWRTWFHTRIKVHIKKELEMRFKTVKLRGQWVESALKRRTGLAFWEAYDAEVRRSVPLLQHVSSQIE